MELLPTLTEALTAETTVVTAWLFGSRARGTARANSDVDIGVIVNDDDPMTRFDIEARLSVLLHLEVQVIDVRRAPSDLTRRIFRDGILLKDNDPPKRIAMIVRKRNEYFEMAPIWRKIRRLPEGVMP